MKKKNIFTFHNFESSGLGEYAKEQIRKHLKAKDGNRNTDTSTNVESAFICKPLGTKENPRFNSPVRIVVRTTYRNQTDNRAVSEKALVDGIVKAGILKDDSKKYVKELIVHEPEISEEEKTEIIITGE